MTSWKACPVHRYRVAVEETNGQLHLLGRCAGCIEEAAEALRYLKKRRKAA
jgi:hypothetical protein